MNKDSASEFVWVRVPYSQLDAMVGRLTVLRDGDPPATVDVRDGDGCALVSFRSRVEYLGVRSMVRGSALLDEKGGEGG